MKRGVITFTKAEVNEIQNRFDLERYSGTPLRGKLEAAFRSEEDTIPIEVSEDELEHIMDEIVIPDPEKDNDATKSLRKKINELLVEFRGGGVETL